MRFRFVKRTPAIDLCMFSKPILKVAMAACFVSASVWFGLGFEIYNISCVLEILLGFNSVLLMFHVCV